MSVLLLKNNLSEERDIERELVSLAREIQRSIDDLEMEVVELYNAYHNEEDRKMLHSVIGNLEKASDEMYKIEFRHLLTLKNVL